MHVVYSNCIAQQQVSSSGVSTKTVYANSSVKNLLNLVGNFLL